MAVSGSEAAESRPAAPGLGEIAAAFLKIGALSYGGPAILGVMQSEIQEERRWLSKEAFLEGLALVNMLPGPPAAQLSIYIGHACRGWRGGVVAGLCFMLPAFIILMSLTWAYMAYGSFAFARHAFYGLGPAVLAIFAFAVWRLAKVVARSPAQIAIAATSAVLLASAPIGIAPVLLLAGCIGVALYHSRTGGLGAAVVTIVAVAGAHVAHPTAAQVSAAAVEAPGLWQLALFFLKVGAFTFGGGITILAFVQDQMVNQFHWLSDREFIDGLALGQLTPGPILMLAAYIGYRLAGATGAVVSACAIFLPAFVLMLSIVPMFTRLKELVWLKAAMRGITSAVIGVLVVSLARLLPHAAPDVFTLIVFGVTLAAMILWRARAIPLMLGGAIAGVLVRLRPL
jgi:chromate transporter